MKRTWIIFDMHSLAYRAFHSTGGLAWKGTPTGVIYGVLGEIIHCQGRFNSNDMVFAFDIGTPLREKLHPEYKIERKKKRKQFTDKEKEAYVKLRSQISRLRKTILKEIGFKNVFAKKGLEADDIIASICKNLDGDKAVIVSSDKDFYQLLSKKVTVYNPRTKTVWTKKRLKQEFGLTPKQWIEMKCLAGCGSDNVCNIPGIRDTTAISYILGKLKPGSVKFNNITSKAGCKRRKLNRPLVKLPFKGTPIYKLKPSKKLDWSSSFQKLGIKSLTPGELEYKEKL